MKAMVKVSALMLFSVLAAGTAARADVSIQWNTDSYSAFDVIISGTGGWQGTITSPSGLWQLSAQSTFGIDYTDYPGAPVNVGGFGAVTFLGQISPNLDPDPSPFDRQMVTQGYNDFFPSSPPFQDGAYWESLYFLTDLGWQGWSPIIVTSTPDINDPSTWNWVSEYTANGPSLEVVPEPATVWVVVFGCALIRLQKKFCATRNDSKSSLECNLDPAVRILGRQKNKASLRMPCCW